MASGTPVSGQPGTNGIDQRDGGQPSPVKQDPPLRDASANSGECKPEQPSDHLIGYGFIEVHPGILTSVAKSSKDYPLKTYVVSTGLSTLLKFDTVETVYK